MAIRTKNLQRVDMIRVETLGMSIDVLVTDVVCLIAGPVCGTERGGSGEDHSHHPVCSTRRQSVGRHRETSHS